MYSCPQWLAVRQSHSMRCHEERSLDPPLRQACYGKPNEIQSRYCNQSETRCWVNGLVVQPRLILDGRHDLRPVKSPELDPYRKKHDVKRLASATATFPSSPLSRISLLTSAAKNVISSTIKRT